MKLIKNIIITVFAITISVLIWWACNAGLGIPRYVDSWFYYNDNPNDNQYTPTYGEPNTNIASMFKNDVENDKSAWQGLLKMFKLKGQDWYWNSEENEKAIYYIKWIVNMLLSLTAFVSLIMVIFAFYMIFFSKEDSGVTKAKQVLKWVALALIVMWLSWFIVSIFFWIERWTTIEGTTISYEQTAITNQNI